jgi:hypothetical protein
VIELSIHLGELPEFVVDDLLVGLTHFSSRAFISTHQPLNLSPCSIDTQTIVVNVRVH